MQPDYTKFFEKQISLTEWFEAIGHPQTTALRQEDNEKRERLAVLNEVIGLPYDKPAQFTAQEVAERVPAFVAYLNGHGDELCCVRLIPTDPTLPKLRMRGESVTKGTAWFDQQKVDVSKYRIDFTPHFTPTWSTIFIVNNRGIFGDITAGNHYKLTQGTPEGMEAVTFAYDFTTKKLQLSREVTGAKPHLKKLLNMLMVSDKVLRQELSEKLGATFAHNYLAGYFETTFDPALGVFFIDYNRLLADELTVGASSPKGAALVQGRCASTGKATGTVCIVQPDMLDASTTLPKSSVLVCTMTTPDYLPLMKQAAAIVTDLGGILSHAAIVARELKIPCVTGTKNATKVLKDGQKVIVDATQGIITAI